MPMLRPLVALKPLCIPFTPSEMRAILRALHVAPSEMAQIIGVSTRAIYFWLQGRNCPSPQAVMLLRLVHSRPYMAGVVKGLVPPAEGDHAAA